MLQRIDSVIVGLIDRINDRKDFPDVFARQIESANDEVLGKHVDYFRPYDQPGIAKPIRQAGERVWTLAGERGKSWL